MPTGQRRPNRISATPSTLAIVCGVLALITTIWAVVNTSRISSLQDDVNALEADNALLRENANATSYPFVSTDITPTNMNGVVYLGTTGSGVVLVNNLPPTGDNEVYQVWLVNADESTIAAGTLTISPNGQGFGVIPADTTGYESIAITLEGNGGADSPSGGFLLVAEVNAGRGLQPQPMAARLLCQNHHQLLLAGRSACGTL